MNSTIEILDFWTCYFLNPQEGQLFASDVEHHGNRTYRCRAYGKFLTGIDPDETFNGHFFCVAICILIFVVGIYGVVSNILNIRILPVALHGSTLQNLLIILAVVELVACLATMIFSFLVISILENIDRSKSNLEWFRISNILFQLLRTGSIYITILTTVERYIVVAFPIKSKIWLKSVNSYVYLTIVAVITIALNLPRLTNSRVDKNDIFTTNVTGEEYPYMFKPTSFSENLNPNIQEILVVLNYVAPLPLLVLFNGLLCISIFRWNKTRVRVSASHKREISAAKMFSFSVLGLLLFHSMSVCIFYTSRVQKIIYRELLMLQSLSLCLSASFNFMVYYFFAQEFRNEFNRLIKSTCRVYAQN